MRRSRNILIATTILLIIPLMAIAQDNRGSAPGSPIPLSEIAEQWYGLGAALLATAASLLTALFTHRNNSMKLQFDAVNKQQEFLSKQNEDLMNSFKSEIKELKHELDEARDIERDMRISTGVLEKRVEEALSANSRLLTENTRLKEEVGVLQQRINVLMGKD